MSIIFEILDKNKRRIYLTDENWKHIVSEHPQLSSGLERIKDTIIKPLTIKSSVHNENVKLYFRYYKERGEYLMADINTILLYVLVGAIFGIVYGLRRIYVIERKIDAIDRRVAQVLIRSRKRK